MNHCITCRNNIPDEHKTCPEAGYGECLTQPMPEEKKMTYDEFLKEYDKDNGSWKFEHFSILCNKCGSKEVEYKGEMSDSSGYYGDGDITHKIVVKCHDCGNAFSMTNTEGYQGGYCNHD